METVSNKINETLKVFFEDVASIRTGRASTDLVNRIDVNVYGGKMKMSELVSASVDRNIITMNAFDVGAVSAISDAIILSDLGVNPVINGSSIRITLPPLSAERRQQLIKMLIKYSESAKIAVRNLRRDHVTYIKKCEKSGEITEDDMRRDTAKLQKLIDEHISKIDSARKTKEEELTSG